MNSPKDILNELKRILEHSSAPSQLDDHPWVQSLLVQTSAERGAGAASPGYRLLAAISDLYRQSRPASPPRRGGRLDTRWGEFALLGALYFTPLDFGNSRPPTLQDAWGRLDEVIWVYQFGRSAPEISEEERARYALARDEVTAAPVSTLSDWHVRGLERLAEQITGREGLLSARYSVPSVLLDPQAEPVELRLNESASSPLRDWYLQHRRNIWLGVGLVLIVLALWQGLGLTLGYRAFKADVDQLQGLISDQHSLDVLEEAGDLLAQTREDALIFQRRLRPWVWAGRLLGWLPVYGGDLAAAGDLVDFAAGLIVAADEGYQAAAPLLEGMQAEGQRPSIPEIVSALSEAQPRFEVAQSAVQSASSARANFDAERLSPKTRLLLEKVDPYLPLLEDGLGALRAVPKLLGAAEYGPQTYLVLIQNEDEIRATGGFITAAAVITVEKGKIIAFKVEDSYSYDDLTRQYPAPPWQMQEYIRAWMFTFRNSNWAPDFPTTAIWAEYLYAYGSAHSVDGVFAIDQYLLTILLEVLGPVVLADAPGPITAENVIDFMRASKSEFSAGDPQRKSFIAPLARELIAKLQGDTGISWQTLGQAVLRALNEKHILLQFDDPAASALVARQGWGGAMHPGEGDYLMVVDTNLGWNKVNAAAEAHIEYLVDLVNLEAPQAHLTLTHRNPTVGDEPCIHSSYGTGDYSELIERCYWDYLRVYTLADAELLDAAVHMLPSNWFIREKIVPARVDILDNQGIVDENPAGLQGYGTMLVVPLAEGRTTRFEFNLPAQIVLQSFPNGEWSYQLRVQKQAGTLAVPLALRVRLPEGAEIVGAPSEGAFQDGLWQADLLLWTDLDISLIFRLP